MNADHYIIHHIHIQYNRWSSESLDCHIHIKMLLSDLICVLAGIHYYLIVRCRKKLPQPNYNSKISSPPKTSKNWQKRSASTPLKTNRSSLPQSRRRSLPAIKYRKSQIAWLPSSSNRPTSTYSPKTRSTPASSPSSRSKNPTERSTKPPFASWPPPWTASNYNSASPRPPATSSPPTPSLNCWWGLPTAS